MHEQPFKRYFYTNEYNETMHRLTRYGISILIAGLVTVFSSTVTDSVLLLAGIGQVYAIGSAIILRPEMRQMARSSGETPDTIFSAVTVFCVLAIAQSTPSQFDFGAAIFTIGISFFGFICGMWSATKIDT